MTFLQRLNFVSRLQSNKKDEQAGYGRLRSQILTLFYLGVSLSIVLPLIVYAYLGTFSRYRADDYCEAMRIENASNALQASMIRYDDRTGRYSTLLLVQVSEWFGRAGMVYMSAAVLLIWLIGLTWAVNELGEATGLQWGKWLSFVVAALAIFFSLYRAPNLFQILFWRSGMVSYLAPLILLTWITAFLLHQLQRELSPFPLIGSGLVVFSGILLAGGTSETVAALQIIVLVLILLACYLWTRDVRKQVFVLLGTALVSAVLAMIIMLLAPGNLTRMGVAELPVPSLFSFGLETLTFALQFLVDSFRVSPLPSFIAFFMPFLLFYGLGNPSAPASSREKRLKWLLVLIPLGTLIAITVNFAPSAYAQSFPSARVRFPSVFLLTITLMAEGSLLGYLLGQRKRLPASMLFRRVALAILLLSCLYPLRAAARIYDQVPEYRARAAAWDARDALIRQAVAQGVTDLEVVQLDTIGGVQEYKGNPTFWVNRCAAAFYGLNSLRAP
jgi:hypothetical protein